MSTTTELYNWLNGTPTGGPNNDGRYPLTAKDGQVYLVYCPAAIALNPALEELPVELFAEQASAAAASASGSATTASGSATAAAASSANAQQYASEALTSKNAAATSASSATTAANQATAAELAAELARDKAQDWATELEDVPVEPGLFSAFHWAQKAADSAASVTLGNYYTKTESDARYRLASAAVTWGEITGKPSTFTPSAHSHSGADITSGTVADARLPTTMGGKVFTSTIHVQMTATGKGVEISSDANQFAWIDFHTSNTSYIDFDARISASGSSNPTSGGATINVQAAAFTFNGNTVAILASPTFTGVPAAPTAAAGTNTTQIATTAFVQTGLAGKANTTHTHVHSDVNFARTLADSTATAYATIPAGLSLTTFATGAEAPVSFSVLCTINGGDNRVGQFAIGSQSDEFYWRGHRTVSSGWQTWRRVWHDGNFTPANKLDTSAFTWANLGSKPTTAAGFGLTDVVTTTGNQTIAGEKNFSTFVTAQSYYDSRGALAGYQFMDRVNTNQSWVWYSVDGTARLFTGYGGVDTFKIDNVNHIVSDKHGRIRSAPTTIQNGNYTFVLQDHGRTRLKSDTGAYSYTVPPSVFGGGDMLSVINDSSTGNITIVPGSGVTLYLAGTTTTGNRTVAPRGVATIVMTTSTTGYVMGAGVT